MGGDGNRRASGQIWALKPSGVDAGTKGGTLLGGLASTHSSLLLSNRTPIFQLCLQRGTALSLSSDHEKCVEMAEQDIQESSLDRDGQLGHTFAHLL